MANVLPAETGLDVTGVIYQYRANKRASDDMVVHVQNENAIGSGYIFRETDDWSQKPGNTISKMVPVDNLNIARWGDGSIAIDGQGTVTDARVIYTYRVDPCFDPQSSPSCDGYVAPVPDIPLVDVNVYDATGDDAVANAMRETDPDLYDEEPSEGDDDDEKSELEKALSVDENALTGAMSVSQSAMIQSMNFAVAINQYYNADIAGGVYRESVTLVDAELPDSRLGARTGLAQQLMHDEMVQMQYK